MKSGLTFAPRLPQARPTNRASISDSLLSSVQRGTGGRAFSKRVISEIDCRIAELDGMSPSSPNRDGAIQRERLGFG